MKTQSQLPPEALSHLSYQPLRLTAQAFRDTAFDTTEQDILSVHLDLWQPLLSKHGVAYEPVLLDGKAKEVPKLIFHLSVSIDTRTHPAALSLVLDAIYELSLQLSADFKVHVSEPVVTQLVADTSQKAFIPDRRLFPQHIQSLPSLEEQSPAEDLFSAMLTGELRQTEEAG